MRAIQSVLTTIILAGILCLAGTPVRADREPVLGQIQVPHSYYFREMYLPQLTSGPSALAWSPGGGELVYSMQGSLWRQRIGDNVAVQLTNGPGYDYQPDWSPDGGSIIFTRYDNDAIELHVLDLSTGRVRRLTDGGGVNLEPRWSPDGSRVAFVSTRNSGRFHVFTGDMVEDELVPTQLVAERESEIPRYYYSSYDHELSPAWAPDGESIYYVGNAEIPYGTGAIWQRALGEDSEPVLIRREETSWKTRPDPGPDGKRLVYSSYLGRQWHQLWIAGVEGEAEPFPLTYGEFDLTHARWSPGGKQIAYIANESGNTEIRIQDMVGGKRQTLEIAERRFLSPMADLNIRITAADSASAAARISVVGADGRSYAPDDAWIHADDGFDRETADFETHYFQTAGDASIAIPPGPARITVWRGLEYEIERRLINVAAGASTELVIQPKPLRLPEDWSDWKSGDVHVHMNYGGAYRNTPSKLVQQGEAEDLDVIFNLIVNKEQRVPDIAYFSTGPDSASSDASLLLHSQEFHTSFWGHMGLLGLQSHLLVPDYSAYPGTGAASIYPDNATIGKLAHQQGAAVGYVHPFYVPPDPEKDEELTNALPVDAALGLVDFYEVVGFAFHRPSAEVWYALMNCGIPIAAAGGTDAMANYASLRGPVGANRTYVEVAEWPDDGTGRRDAWIRSLKAGKSIATNGPLLGISVNDTGPGGVIELDSPYRDLEFRGFMRSPVPIDHLELVQNGEVVKTFPLSGDRRTVDISGSIPAGASGWVLLRAWNEEAHPLIFDIYPYASTSAVRISVQGMPQTSDRDAEYFLAWIERIRDTVATHPDYNNDGERTTILQNLDAATAFYENCKASP